MRKIDITMSYDELLTHVEECNQALPVVWEWLNKSVDTGKQIEVFSFFQDHDSRLAVLNLTMEKLDNLTALHRQKINQALQEG